MHFGPASWLLAFSAGGLSILSPCVLPLVPILVGAGATVHRAGPLALASGLAVSFSVVGTAIASAGSLAGVEQDHLRIAGAIMLAVFGAVLLSARLQEEMATRLAGLSGAGHAAMSRITLQGLPGQFVVGMLLGVVWTPCVGPTLGAVITMAGRGDGLGEAGVMMSMFGVGAAVPLVLVGLLSRQVFTRWRGRLLGAAGLGKRVLGAVMVLMAAAVLTGSDKSLERWLVAATPEWLVRLATSI